MSDVAELTHAQLVGLLRAAYEAREAAAAYSKDYERLKGLFRAYLDAHPEEVLWDGEAKLEASLGTAPSVNQYDIADAPWTLIEEMHRARLLTVNHKAVEALTDQRLKADVRRFHRRGIGTRPLELTKK